MKRDSMRLRARFPGVSTGDERFRDFSESGAHHWQERCVLSPGRLPDEGIPDPSFPNRTSQGSVPPG